MGRKKRRGVDLKPFCYYCDREFDDEKVLIQHQKAKHFKCSECNRKLDTAAGLVVHLSQVHKEVLTKVPNALSGRDEPEVIIHGMDGIPQNILLEKQGKLKEKNGLQDAAKQQRVQWAQVGVAPTMEQFFQQQSSLPHLPNMPLLSAFPGANGLPYAPPVPMMMGMPGTRFQMPLQANTGVTGSASSVQNLSSVSTGLQSSPFASMTRHVTTAQPRGVPTPPPPVMPPGTSPSTQIAASQPSWHMGQSTSFLQSAATPLEADRTAVESKSTVQMISLPKFPPHGSYNGGPPAAAAAVAASATKPANLKLYYDDDMTSPEEKRAMREYGYQPKALIEAPRSQIGPIYAQ